MGDVVSNGVRLYCETFGEGEPVLLIPGTSMRPALFQLEFVPAIVDAGFQAVLVGNRGVEPSEAPPAPYSVADMTADAAGVIETLEIGPCHVVGYSLGGFIAEELCYQRPDLVRDVVLIASAGRGTSFLRIYHQAEVDSAMTLDPPVASQALRTMLLLLYPVGTLQEDDATVELLAELLEAAPPWTNPGRLGQWSADLAWGNDEARIERWPQLQQRCLAIAFEHDLLWPPSRAREAAQAMPNARVEVIAGAAHGGFLTHAEPVCAAIIEFLRQP